LYSGCDGFKNAGKDAHFIFYLRHRSLTSEREKTQHRRSHQGIFISVQVRRGRTLFDLQQSDISTFDLKIPDLLIHQKDHSLHQQEAAGVRTVVNQQSPIQV
jgi:hypothetical protein